jgi:NhaP-type Na+/H+ or K+/H+ antiporter
VQPRVLGAGLFSIVDLAVAVIVFEGGLNLEVSRLRREQTPIRRLVTWGALVTAAGGALAAGWLLGWHWGLALLFGSHVVVTGPTVIGPLVSDLRLRPRVGTVLEAEGVLIDPIGAILAVLVLELTLTPRAETFAAGGMQLLLQLGFGTLAGAAGGLVLNVLLRIRRLVPEGFGNIFVLASVLLLFQGCQELVPHSGILAVAIAGVVLGNLHSPVSRDVREFKDQLTVLLIGLLFVLLAADVRFEDVRALGWAGLGAVAALVVVVRPLDVLVSTAGSALQLREKLLLAWLAPRGIVAAAIASLTAASLEQHELPGGAELRALVFLTIAVTVLLAGFTGRPVATLLGQRLPGRDTVAILGAQGLGLALASELRDAGQPVVFLDSNPSNCRRAEEAGFPVVYGDAVQERTLQRARFEMVASVIGLTPNDALNGLFVSRARELFRVPHAYVATARAGAGVAPELMRSAQAVMLFEASHDAERWDVRARHGDLELEHWVFRGAPPAEASEGEGQAPPSAGERFVILAIRRGRSTRPMSVDFKIREGDVASVAVHAPEREEAHRILQQLGWEPAAAPDAGSETASGPATE